MRAASRWTSEGTWRVRAFCLAFVILAYGSAIKGQQLPDSSFHFANAHPAFAAGAGPAVCVDAAHNNFHTLEDRYYAFGRLIRADGFRSISLTERLHQGVPAHCAVFVIANALPARAGDPGADLNAPAFSPHEVRRILEWVVGGGRLLLIMDHSPYPAAVADLAAVLGVLPLNGGAKYRMFGELPDASVRNIVEQHGVTADSVRAFVGPLGTLGDHSILQGRPDMDLPVRSVMTFGGSTFYPAGDMRPLLQVPAHARGTGRLPGPFQEHAPRYSLDGWLVGGAREVGPGRVVILGEAAMCSAQLAGPSRTPMGMNDPLATDNAQFCLNIVRWLAGVF